MVTRKIQPAFLRSAENKIMPKNVPGVRQISFYRISLILWIPACRQGWLYEDFWFCYGAFVTIL